MLRTILGVPSAVSCKETMAVPYRRKSLAERLPHHGLAHEFAGSIDKLEGSVGKHLGVFFCVSRVEREKIDPK
jgi:hypothetical protein